MDEIRTYLNAELKLKVWPGKLKNQMGVLKYLASKFEIGKFYTEKEVNEVINQYHVFNDPALLRRELFEKKFLDRELNGSKYWKI